LRFWLHLDVPRNDERGWVLNSKAVRGTLILDVEGRRLELKLGQSVRLPGGELDFAELRAWMGYKIYFDPTLPWLLFVAAIGLLGLGWHLWQPLGRLPVVKSDQNHGQSAGALT
jgi:cytochrome c biogenesis protein